MLYVGRVFEKDQKGKKFQVGLRVAIRVLSVMWKLRKSRSNSAVCQVGTEISRDSKTDGGLTGRDSSAC